MAEIHKAALERTSISVDKLISCLSEMQVIAQKQEVVVPITTRGVGFLVNESYQEAVSACPKACGTCSDVAAYRVCLAQQQVQLVKSDREASLNDPYVERLQHVECNTISTTILEQASSTPQSFRLTADFVNSIGKFEHQGTSYRPIVMSPYIGGVSERSGDSDLVPDPYAVTFKNLRATVVALADEQTPVEARRHFIANNPLLGATWNGDKLLNLNHIIPADYGVAELARDQRAFRAFLSTIGGKCPHLVGECVFNGRGNAAQLVSVYQDRIKLDGVRLVPPKDTVRFRCFRQLEPGFLVRGAIGLFGEYPIDTVSEFYSMRNPIVCEQYIDVCWSMLVARALAR